MSETEELPDPQKVRAILLLATTERTLADIAEELGISTRTLQRWREAPDFQRSIVAEMRRELVTMAGVAASRIRRMMRDARDRDVAPVLRMYLQAIGVLGGDDPAEQADRGPVILPADSDEWQALGQRKET